MLKKYHRFFAALTLFLIMVYGILKNWVLRVYASSLDYIAQIFGVENNWIFETIRNQSKYVKLRDQTLGWIIYYPSYYLLHILFIYLLFNNNQKARNYLMIGLTLVITMIIGLWIFFQLLNQEEVADFFRGQFKKLFGLPFILLAIEGGRILYMDLEKRLNQ